MMTLVVGGSASGKSAWAEELAVRSPRQAPDLHRHHGAL